jgi:WD40 repeat protein
MIVCAVRWYLRFSLSYRDVEELLIERGLPADHTTIWFLVPRPSKPEMQFRRLTFRRGTIHDARVTPDGSSIIYSAKWEDEPSDVFTARLDSPGSRSLGLSGSELRAVSTTGELALAQMTHFERSGHAFAGSLLRAPLSGGTPRPVEEKIAFADWSPDGKEMAVVRETDQGIQLEFPPGNVLYRTAGYMPFATGQLHPGCAHFWQFRLGHDCLVSC